MESSKILSQKYVHKYTWILTIEKCGIVMLKVSCHLLMTFCATAHGSAPLIIFHQWSPNADLTLWLLMIDSDADINY